MALDREGIYAALLARLAAVAGLGTAGASRKFRGYENVEPTEQPAAFLIAGDELGRNQKGRPTVWTLTPEIYVYARTDSESGNSPGSVLNPVLTAIEAALEDNTAGGKQHTTLGGRCTHCWISRIEIGEGTTDGQGVARLHLEILAPGGG